MIAEEYFRLKKNGKPTSRCYCTTPWLIENYDKAIADKTQVWECHHKAEVCHSVEELIENGDYYNVPPCNLIFLTAAEHNWLHTSVLKDRAKPHSEETKKKQSDAAKKRYKDPNERKKTSDALKKYKRTVEHQRHINESRIGKGVVEKPLRCIETNVVYKSIYEASHKTNIHGCNIYRCCVGKRKSAGGYHWEYIGE